MNNNLGIQTEDSNLSYELLKLPDVKELLKLKERDKISISGKKYVFDREESGIFYLHSANNEELFAIDKFGMIQSVDSDELPQDLRVAIDEIRLEMQDIMDSYPEVNLEALKKLEEGGKILQ